MAVWSIVNFNHIQKKNRLDSEYYQPEYMKFEESMKQWGDLLRLQDVTSVIGGKRLPKGETFSVKGIPYVRTVDIKNVFTDFDKVQNIPNEIYQVLKRYQLKYKDILITIVGSIGLIGYMQEDISPCNFTENCAVVRSKKVSSEFLLAVLISKIGQYQINREKVGTIQDKLALERLRNFLIPIAKSKALEIDIENNIKQANENYKKSKLLYSQAEKILLEELGLKDLDLKDDLFYTTTLKEVKDNNRMEAEYYIPKYEELIAHIRNYKNGYCGLFDIAQNITTNYDPLKEGERFRYIELSNIQASIGIIENAKRLRTEDAPSRAKLKLKKGDVIVSSIKGSLDKTAMVVSDFDGAFASNGFFQFRTTSVNPAYLTLLIKSDIVYLQLFREASGAILSAVPKESLKNIIIPKLDKNIQEEISKFVQNAHEKYHKSKLLLEQAKHKVEEMIEKEAEVK